MLSLCFHSLPRPIFGNDPYPKDSFVLHLMPFGHCGPWSGICLKGLSWPSLVVLPLCQHIWGGAVWQVKQLRTGLREESSSLSFDFFCSHQTVDWPSISDRCLDNSHTQTKNLNAYPFSHLFSKPKAPRLYPFVSHCVPLWDRDKSIISILFHCSMSNFISVISPFVISFFPKQKNSRFLDLSLAGTMLGPCRNSWH